MQDSGRESGGTGAIMSGSPRTFSTEIPRPLLSIAIASGIVETPSFPLSVMAKNAFSSMKQHNMPRELIGYSSLCLGPRALKPILS